VTTGNFSRTPLIFFMIIITIWAVYVTVPWNTDTCMIAVIITGLIIGLFVYLLKTERIRVKL